MPDNYNYKLYTKLYQKIVLMFNFNSHIYNINLFWSNNIDTEKFTNNRCTSWWILTQQTNLTCNLNPYKETGHCQNFRSLLMFNSCPRGHFSLINYGQVWTLRTESLSVYVWLNIMFVRSVYLSSTAAVISLYCYIV